MLTSIVLWGVACQAPPNPGGFLPGPGAVEPETEPPTSIVEVYSRFVDFGTWSPGATVPSELIEIRSTGNAPVTLTSVGPLADGEPEDGVFRVDVPFEPPFELAAGEGIGLVANVVVPTDYRAFAERILVTTDAIDAAEIVITLTLEVECDIGPTGLDVDLDGIPDGCDACRFGDDRQDADADTVPDACDVCPGEDDRVDTDNNGVPDCADACFGGDPFDGDGDTVPDFCDVCPGSDDRLDADGDGTPDGCDRCPGFDDSIDSDGDSVPDGCDITP